MELDRALSMIEIVEEQKQLLSEQQEVIMLLEQERQELKKLLWKAEATAELERKKNERNSTNITEIVQLRGQVSVLQKEKAELNEALGIVEAEAKSSAKTLENLLLEQQKDVRALKELEQNNRKLEADSLQMAQTLREWEGKYNTLLERLRELEQSNEQIRKVNEQISHNNAVLTKNLQLSERELEQLSRTSGQGSPRPQSQTENWRSLLPNQ